MSDDTADEEVGYGRPPKSTRFKAGNQAARRRGKRKRTTARTDRDEIIENILQERVTVRVAGEDRRVSVQEALVLRLGQEALQGKAWANDLVMKLLALVPVKKKPWVNHMDHEGAIKELEKRLKEFASRRTAKANEEPET